MKLQGPWIGIGKAQRQVLAGDGGNQNECTQSIPCSQMRSVEGERRSKNAKGLDEQNRLPAS